MKGWRSKTLRYARAVYHSEGKEQDCRLQQVLQSICRGSGLPARRMERDGRVLELRSFEDGRNAFFFHLVGYTPGEQASTVPLTDADQDLNTLTAPEGEEFLDGDLMGRVADNDVLFCSSPMRETRLPYFITNLAKDQGGPTATGMFNLLRVSDRDKHRVVQQEGVKEIRLKSFSYLVDGHEGDLSLLREPGRLRQWADSLRRAFYDMVGRDLSVEEMEEASELMVEVIIRAKHGAHLAYDALEGAADDLLDDGGGFFEIKTKNDTKISADELSISKEKKLPPFGQTVRHEDVWDELERYWGELRRFGATER